MRAESDWFAHDDNAAAQSSPNNRVQCGVFMGTAPLAILKFYLIVKKF
jgi:hypothetical protein